MEKAAPTTTRKGEGQLSKKGEISGLLSAEREMRSRDQDSEKNRRDGRCLKGEPPERVREA
jgi:hypothetical protein